MTKPTRTKTKAPSLYSSTWVLELDHVDDWAFAENVFTPDECKQLIELGESKSYKTATISDTNKENKNIRDSEIAWLFAQDGITWAFERLTGVVNHLNNNFFKFDLFSFGEGLQFTKYNAPGGMYVKHTDRGLNMPPRKLSFSVQLNDSSEFDGGNLLLHISSEPRKPEMKQGKLLAFPSYVLHEVTPVTRGTRYSLVGWISGKPFK